MRIAFFLAAALTAAPVLAQASAVPPSEHPILLKDRVISNWYFGVASVSKDGFESPVVFPGPAGAF